MADWEKEIAASPEVSEPAANVAVSEVPAEVVTTVSEPAANVAVSEVPAEVVTTDAVPATEPVEGE
jgi:hypothetical protein